MLVVRNIPACIDQARLFREWPPQGSFDFFYRPYKFSEQEPKPYAFINFVSPRHAHEFQQQWHGSTRFDDRRPLNIFAGRENVVGYLEKVAGKILTLHAHGQAPVLFRGARRLNTLDVMHGIGLMRKHWGDHE